MPRPSVRQQASRWLVQEGIALTTMGILAHGLRTPLNTNFPPASSIQ